MAGSIPTRRWIATAMASTIAPKAPGRALALARASVAQQAFLPDSACWQYPGLDPLSPLVGWLPQRLARQQAQPPAVLSARSQRLAYLRKMPTPTLRASAGAARWFQRGSPTPN